MLSQAVTEDEVEQQHSLCQPGIWQLISYLFLTVSWLMDATRPLREQAHQEGGIQVPLHSV